MIKMKFQVKKINNYPKKRLKRIFRTLLKLMKPKKIEIELNVVDANDELRIMKLSLMLY
jgi:NADPH-dependent 7-cyano-7-deazaguanine reductase QueF